MSFASTLNRGLLAMVLVALLLVSADMVTRLPAAAYHVPEGAYLPTMHAKLCNDLPAGFGGPSALHGGGGNCVEDHHQSATPDLSMTYELGAGNLAPSLGDMYLALSGDFSMPADGTIPIGAVVGGVTASFRSAFFNNACGTAIFTQFILYSATTDINNQVPVSPIALDNLAVDGTDAFQGKADASSPAVTKYPSSTSRFFDPDGIGRLPSVRPRARYAGMTQVGGTWELFQVVVFAPGTLQSAFRSDPHSRSHPFTHLASSLGWTMIVLIDDPLASQSTPRPLSVFCSPLTFTGMLLGKVDTNNDGVPDTARLTSPANAGGIDGEGTQLLQLFSMSQRDFDADGLSNAMDTCPTVANIDDPYTTAGSDLDGLDPACDPTPNSDTNAGDHDGDGYLNMQDNCPLVANGSGQAGVPGVGNQRDSEVVTPRDIAAPDGGPWGDQLGDACDSEMSPSNSDTVANGSFYFGKDVQAFCINDVAGSDEDGDGWCAVTSAGADPNDANASVTGEQLVDSDGYLYSGPGHNYSDLKETYIQTDPLADCPEVIGEHDAWPPDFDKNRVVNVIDVLFYKGRTPSAATTRALKRLDLDASGTVNVQDILIQRAALLTTCTPA